MKWLLRPWCWLFGHEEHPLQFGDVQMWVEFEDGSRERVESVPGLSVQVTRQEYECPRCGATIVQERQP